MLYRPGLLGRLPCPQDWYAGSGPPTVSDDFTGPVSLPAGWTFTRASANATNCLYTDSISAPAFTTYAANAPRFLDFGLLMEPIRTNLFLNSEAPVTQTITVAVGDYVLWYLGPATSSVNMVFGTAVGTGFNPTAVSYGTIHVTTAGTITVNCVSSPTRVQLEKGTTPTSYIVSTATAQTRQEDRLSKNYLGGQLNAVQGTYWVEFLAQVNFNDGLKSEAPGRLMVASSSGSYSSNNASDQLTTVSLNGTNNSIQSYIYSDAGANQAGAVSMAPPSIGRVSRVAYSVSPTKNSIAADYTFGGIGVFTGTRPSALLAVCLGGGGGGGNGNNGGAAGSHIPFNGFIRGFKYWPVAMPDAELKECTGAGYYGGPPVFDYDFTTGVLPRRLAFTRSAWTGTITDSVYTDAPGSTYNTFTGPTSARFFGSRGLLLELLRFNFFPFSAAPVTRTTTSFTAGQTYCAWIIGTGSATLSNATGTLGTVTGPNPLVAGTPTWFNVSVTGTLTVTIAGSVNRMQIENVANNATATIISPSTFIVVSGASAASRGLEQLSMPAANWFNNSQGTYFIEYMDEGWNYTYQFPIGASSSATAREQIVTQVADPSVPSSTAFAQSIYPGGGVTSIHPIANFTPGVMRKVAYTTYMVQSSAYRSMIAIGGVLGVAGIGDLTSPLPPYPTTFNINGNPAGGPGNRFIKRVRYYDYAMTDDQLVALTT